MIWIIIGIGFLLIEVLILHDAAREEGHDKESATHNPGNVSIILGTPENEEARVERHRAAERDHWSHERCHNLRVAIFSGVAAAAAILAAVIAACAFVQTKRQADEAAKQTRISEQQNLPIIFVEFDEVNAKDWLSGKGTMIAKYHVNNYGRAPAVVRRIECLFAVVPARTYPDFAMGSYAPHEILNGKPLIIAAESKSDPIDCGGFGWPVGPVGSEIPRIPWGATEDAVKERMRQVVQEQLWLLGSATYEDLSHVTYRTTFCLKVRPVSTTHEDGGPNCNVVGKSQSSTN